MKQSLVAIMLLLFWSVAFSQDKSSGWQPAVAINFTSVPTVNISGSDTSFVNNLSVAPSISIRNHSGWGVVYSPYFVTEAGSESIYMHKVTFGLEQYDKASLDLVAEYSHFFFIDNRGIPLSPITNEIYVSSMYKKTFIRPLLSAGLGFGTDKTSSSSSEAYDIELAAGISHSFEWNINNTSLNVSPSILINAGTNEYFSFLKLSKYISHSKKFTKVVKKFHARNSRSSSSGTQSTSEAMSLTNVELNLESSLDIGSFNIRPAGSIFFPFSSGESAGGYWEVTLTYNF